LAEECASEKIFENWSTIGKDMDSSKVAHIFMARGVG